MEMKKSQFLCIWLLLAGFLAATAVVLAAYQVENAKLPKNVGRELKEMELAEVAGRNSSLITYAYLSPNADFPRADTIKKITIHHMGGVMTLEKCGQLFSNKDRRASANYGIDSNGRIACYVEEDNRSWASSSRENDHQAITIEVSNDETGGGWHVSDASLQSLIRLCTDICRRNNISELNYTGDASGNVTIHSMFSDNTECPGPYLEGKIPEIVSEVNWNLAVEP